MPTRQTNLPPEGRDFLSLRKRLARQARREHPGRKVCWLGGILYFCSCARPTSADHAFGRVPDVPAVPKPGANATGLDGAFPSGGRQAAAWGTRRRW